jgi:hypothetical protein
MALYPDTSCFYRAEVIATPKDMQGGGRVSMNVLAKEAILTIYTECTVIKVHANIQIEV